MKVNALSNHQFGKNSGVACRRLMQQISRQNVSGGILIVMAIVSKTKQNKTTDLSTLWAKGPVNTQLSDSMILKMLWYKLARS